MAIRFGAGFPGCREGTAYPVGFVSPENLTTFARRAEELGYYSIWSNDHLTSRQGIRETQAGTPNFYEPLVTYASLVNVTERLRFMLSTIVVPQRDIVLLAKQVATLDRLSGGRVMLGVGLGSNREEFEALHPAHKHVHRGRWLEEGIRGLRLLFGDAPASLQGEYVQFAGVELAPKPSQAPFPVYLAAHKPVGLQRVGRLADGLILAGLSPERAGRAWDAVKAAAAAHGRDPNGFSLHVQTWLTFGDGQRDAEIRALRSQHLRRMAAETRRSEADILAGYRAGNLLGTPAEIVDQIRAFEAIGATHLGIVFVVDTMEELLHDVDVFARSVMPAFAAA